MRYDDDQLDLLLRVAMRGYEDDEVSSLLALDTSIVVHDRQYKTRMKRYLKKIEERQRDSVFHVVFMRVVVPLLVLMSLAFALIISISATRQALWQVIVEWYDEYVQISFEPPESVTRSQDESDQATIPVAPSSVEQVRKPTYLPDGLEEEVVLHSKKIVSIDYYQGDD